MPAACAVIGPRQGPGGCGVRSQAHLRKGRGKEKRLTAHKKKSQAFLSALLGPKSLAVVLRSCLVTASLSCFEASWSCQEAV